MGDLFNERCATAIPATTLAPACTSRRADLPATDAHKPTTLASDTRR